MKANKVTVEIKMESLSIDTLRGMLDDVIKQVEGEVDSGELAYRDGDVITWKTTYTPVEF